MSISLKKNPIELYNKWAQEAKNTSSIAEPTAVALSTATSQGIPSVRMVLIKKSDEKGFVFYTNLESQKAVDLFENPHASFCQHWMPLEKQIRVGGRVEPVSESEADEYFDTRDRMSRIGAWASKQSSVMKDQFELEKNMAKFTAQFVVKKLTRPKHWSGFRIIPEYIEFWHAKKFRLHDRIRFIKRQGTWQADYLFP